MYIQKNIKIIFILFLLVFVLGSSNSMASKKDKFIKICVQKYDNAIKDIKNPMIKRWQWKEYCECKANILNVMVGEKDVRKLLSNRNFIMQLNRRINRECTFPIAKKYGWKFEYK